jgi:hypothetical protein
MLWLYYTFFFFFASYQNVIMTFLIGLIPYGRNVQIWIKSNEQAEGETRRNECEYGESI